MTTKREMRQNWWKLFTFWTPVQCSRTSATVFSHIEYEQKKKKKSKN